MIYAILYTDSYFGHIFFDNLYNFACGSSFLRKTENFSFDSK